MNHYIDILIKPDAEMRENLLLNKVYSKLHKALVDLKSTDIGVSFPQYEIILGKVLRLHGSEVKLSDLQESDWLGGLKSYCNISAIEPAPSKAHYRTVSRKQSNMTEAKLRRLIKRGSIGDSELKTYKAKMFSKGLDNPYLELKSSSNGHKHRRYIQFGELSGEPVEGFFDQYGLSKTATVPWF